MSHRQQTCRYAVPLRAATKNTDYDDDDDDDNNNNNNNGSAN